MATTQELQDFTQQVRRDILRMVHAVNSGHPGGSLGCAEFFTVLYQDIMEYSLILTWTAAMKTCSSFLTDIFLLCIIVFCQGVVFLLKNLPLLEN